MPVRAALAKEAKTSRLLNRAALLAPPHLDICRIRYDLRGVGAVNEWVSSCIHEVNAELHTDARL